MACDAKFLAAASKLWKVKSNPKAFVSPFFGLTTYIVVACIVMACIVMACIALACRVMACIVVDCEVEAKGLGLATACG